MGSGQASGAEEGAVRLGAGREGAARGENTVLPSDGCTARGLRGSTPSLSSPSSVFAHLYF